MSEVKCPRCSQLFRHESDPKLGELVPIGSVTALEMVEKIAVEKAALNTEMQSLRRQNTALQKKLDEIGECTRQHQTDEDRDAVKIVQSLLEHRRMLKAIEAEDDDDDGR